MKRNIKLNFNKRLLSISFYLFISLLKVNNSTDLLPEDNLFESKNSSNFTINPDLEKKRVLIEDYEPEKEGEKENEEKEEGDNEIENKEIDKKIDKKDVDKKKLKPIFQEIKNIIDKHDDIKKMPLDQVHQQILELLYKKYNDALIKDNENIIKEGITYYLNQIKDQDKLETKKNAPNSNNQSENIASSALPDKTNTKEIASKNVSADGNTSKKTINEMIKGYFGTERIENKNLKQPKSIFFKIFPLIESLTPEDQKKIIGDFKKEIKNIKEQYNKIINEKIENEKGRNNVKK